MNLLGVLRKSLIFASLISGTLFIIKAFSEPAVTGAVVGTQIIDPYILVSVTLFLVAMALTHFFEHE